MAQIGEIPENVLNLIYDAAGESNLWPSVLQAIARHLNSAGGILFGQSVQNKIVFFEYNGGLCEDCSQIYRERHIRNPWSLHMMRQPEGRVVSSDEVIALSALKQTAFFDEVLRPQKIAHNAMIGLSARESFVAAFNLSRGTDQGPFEKVELEFLERLVPHMQRSLQLGFRLDAYRALQCAQYEVLDRLALGIILLNRRGAILYANLAARTLCAGGTALTLREDRLSHASHLHAPRLDSLLERVLVGCPMAVISIPRDDGDLPLTILAAAIRGRDVGCFSEGGLKDAAAVLFISNPASGSLGWIEGAYGMTPAEAAVAGVAATGASVSGIALALHLSPNTVKTHLRRIFAKTGAKGQAELVRLITPLSLVASRPTFTQ